MLAAAGRGDGAGGGPAVQVRHDDGLAAPPLNEFGLRKVGAAVGGVRPEHLGDVGPEVGAGVAGLRSAEALRAAGDEQVKLQLKGALNPMIISPMEGDKYTYLVLPVRLKAND